MRKNSLCLILLMSAVFIVSCDKPNVRMHTIIREDGLCEREVSYTTIMSKEMRDSLWSGNKVSWACPVPECLNPNAFMGSHTRTEEDTVTTTFRNIFHSVEEMCLQSPLQLNGARLKSTAKLEKKNRWFYTLYTYTETFTCVGDTFKIPATDYADKDVVRYWFTGQPNLLHGLSGAEASEKIRKMESCETQWINDNFFKLCFDFIVNNYDSIQNPPVGKEQFVELHDSLANYLLSSMGDILLVNPNETFEKFFHSDAYAIFFDGDTPCGKALEEELSTHMNIFWFSVPYSLTMPGTIVDAGTGVVKDGVIHYPLTGERLIPQDYTITATSRVTHGWTYIVAVLIFVVFIGSFLYKGRKRKDKRIKSRFEERVSSKKNG